MASTPDVLDNATNRPPLSRARTYVILSCLFLSLFTAALDFTITAPASPSIVAAFHSGSAYTWIGSAYLLANATASPVWGKLSDIFGRKPILLSAVSVFLIGSLLCAAAPNMGMFISGRAIQGSGSGGVVILVNICITDMFDFRRRGMYLGLTSVVWALASGIGPVLGGIFTQLVSWRWNWWINLPCCAVTFGVLFWVLDIDTQNRNQGPSNGEKVSFRLGLKKVDWLGITLILGVTLMLLLGLNFGGTSFAWRSPTVICLIIFGAVMVPLFVVSEAKYTQHPIMPLRLFKKSQNVAALLVCFCHGFVYISAFYFIPIFFQAVKGTSIMMSGVLILPITIVQCLTGIATGFIIKHTVDPGHYRIPIIIGMTLLTLGFGLFMYIDALTPLTTICILEALAGLGVGLNFQSPLIALQDSVDSSDFATATATFGFTRNIATSLSIVMGGVIFQNGMATANLDTTEFNGADAEANVDLVASLPMAQRDEVRAAYVNSLRTMWILYTCVAAVGVGASCFLLVRGKKEAGTDAEEDINAALPGGRKATAQAPGDIVLRESHGDKCIGDLEGAIQPGQRVRVYTE
ncbi:MDR family MFS transporter [Aspergillus stella-maris]|uniref:MDR family MFS transporter n=1 Tax=Aspergillus stella-maris TaxID=1810926 RepID=UPI003CCD0F64